MAISSEQYKTAIFEMARRSFRVQSANARVLYYNMMYSVLEHDGVTVDAEGYDGIRVAVEGYLDYQSAENHLTPTAIRGDENFTAKYEEFFAAPLARIGIVSTTVIKTGDAYAEFTFTYSDGETETYTIGDGQESPSLNIRFNSTLDYAQKVMPYWAITPSEDLIPLNELHRLRGNFVTNWEGEGVYWSFDKETQTIEFTGTGALFLTPQYFKGTTERNSMNLGDILTAVYGAGVTSIPHDAFNWGTNGTTRTIVCLHGATDTVACGRLASVGTSGNPGTLEIYCDNEAIRAGTFGEYTIANWRPLSEWTG